jgi:hypothetical protein
MGTHLLGELPALPLHTAGKYVAAAYIVLFVLVLIYVSIMALRLTRVERELGELLALSQERAAPPRPGARAEAAAAEAADADAEPDDANHVLHVESHPA